MFDNLTERLTRAIKNLRGQGRLTEQNISDTLREVRMALLEADVALPVVKQFIEAIRARAVGQEVMGSLTPGQALIKIVHDELVVMMGEANETLNLNARPPVVILMAGLQGSGKTTTVAKLAKLLKERLKKKVWVTSVDVYRPAAIDQLETLAHAVGVDFFPSHTTEEPVTIAVNAIAAAEKAFADVLLVDTAGRLHIDADMMAEIKQLHAAVSPTETLFVVDSMTGQDAANTAKAFHEALPLTGVILTKTDGDARGGAALSIRAITGKPIKFIGVGEKIDALEPFYPDRMASRILGMGDVLGLVEELQQKVDQKKAMELAKKAQKGRFDLEMFKDQLQQMQTMGGMGGLMAKLPIPGLNKLPNNAASQGDKTLKRFEAMINSMTKAERQRPELINGSRKRRITQGSGTSVPELNRLLKQFTQMQKMMKKLSSKGGMAKMMRAMQGMMSQGGGGF